MTTTLIYSDAGKVTMAAYLMALRAHRQNTDKPGADDRLAHLDDLCDAAMTQLLTDNPDVSGELPPAAPRLEPLRYSQHAAARVATYIGLHRHLRQSGAYGDAYRLRQLQAAGVTALHAILQGNPATGFAEMIEQCNALERPA